VKSTTAVNGATNNVNNYSSLAYGSFDCFVQITTAAIITPSPSTCLATLGARPRIDGGGEWRME